MGWELQIYLLSFWWRTLKLIQDTKSALPFQMNRKTVDCISVVKVESSFVFFNIQMLTFVRSNLSVSSFWIPHLFMCTINYVQTAAFHGVINSITVLMYTLLTLYLLFFQVGLMFMLFHTNAERKTLAAKVCRILNKFESTRSTRTRR